jgi:hypothetical protein
MTARPSSELRNNEKTTDFADLLSAFRIQAETNATQSHIKNPTKINAPELLSPLGPLTRQRLALVAALFAAIAVSTSRLFAQAKKPNILISWSDECRYLEHQAPIIGA